VVLVLVCALPSSASAIELINPEAFHINPEELPHSGLGSDFDALKVNEGELHAADEEMLEEADSEAHDELDWCLWSGLEGMATEMASGTPPSEVGAALESKLFDCMTEHFERKAEASEIAWVAKGMRIKTELELLEQLGQTAEEAWATLNDGGLTLPAKLWGEWFARAAAAVPPVAY
jgi:hypothetical protein